MRRLVRFSLLSSCLGLVGLTLLVVSPAFQRALDIVERTLTGPEVVTRVVEVPVEVPVAIPVAAPVNTNTNTNTNINVSTNVNINTGSHTHGNAHTAHVGVWDKRTCTVDTHPAGASVWRRNLFGEPEYLGRHPPHPGPPPELREGLRAVTGLPDRRDVADPLQQSSGLREPPRPAARYRLSRPSQLKRPARNGGTSRPMSGARI